MLSITLGKLSPIICLNDKFDGISLVKSDHVRVVSPSVSKIRLARAGLALRIEVLL